MSFSPVETISKKRDGHAHTDGELEILVREYLRGGMTDYQMSAWLMAVYLNGLDDREMTTLTRVMLESGTTLRLARVKRPKIDKHSTGGVGDKISIPLAPLVAEAGLAVPMIAGRGLGHTGGTLDKLESIRGYRTRLDAREFERIVAKVGVSLIGQTDEMAPADRRIYSLRDVTGTVESRPLIVASILSKKLAAGLDGLVLDVKVGRGAFMKDRKHARALARSLVDVGSRLGMRTKALLTSMDDPLGDTVGNALEIEESIRILRNEGPKDTTELTLRLGAEMLVVGGIEATVERGVSRLRSILEKGTAHERFVKMVELHGGDPHQVEDPKKLPRAKHVTIVKSGNSGFVQAVDSLALAHLALELGAGRKHAEDKIEPAVGLRLLVSRGDSVARGTPIAEVHSATETSQSTHLVRSAFFIADDRPKQLRRILEEIE